MLRKSTFLFAVILAGSFSLAQIKTETPAWIAASNNYINLLREWCPIMINKPPTIKIQQSMNPSNMLSLNLTC